MRLIDKLNLLQNKKILVLGDLMLDEYEYGEVSRISQEAPVQVVKFEYSKKVIGGAGNTANNLVSLGAEVFLAGIVGSDRKHKELLECLKQANINSEGVITDNTKPTIVKKRIVSGKNQLIRIDYEDNKPIDHEAQEKIKQFIQKKIDLVDVIVISDYDKGLINVDLMKFLINLSNEKKIPTVLDGKSQNLECFKDVTLITPNIQEARQMSGIYDNVEEMGKVLVSRLNTNLFLTRGADGISVFEKNGKITHVPTKKVPVYDVTGAGDTVVAISALGLASGMNFKEIAEIANIAGRIVVQKPGTATVTLEEIRKTMDSISIRESHEKYKKKWGYEEWIVNLDSAGYCGKKLILNKGYQCSIHYHKEKDEVFYINKGFVLMTIDGKQELMKPESRIRIEPGTRHRFIGLTDAEIIEISSFHKEEDSYRDEPSGRVNEEKFKNYIKKYSDEINE
ncbi:cupin domain-containing protein [Candidatus Woesearchaeota archaeon]|nr:cupin domain-containing protein [Candidatus Woesearchaeota archaeon]